MSTWSFVDAGGRFVGIQFCGDAADLAINTPEGCTAMPGRIDHTAWRLDARGQLVPLPVDMEAERARHWKRMKAMRAWRLSGTFPALGHVFQIDPLNVPGAALDAMRAQQAGDPWQQAWVLADNTIATLDAAQMIAVGRAMRQAISDLWATSEALRAQIQAAQTPQELAAIAWPEDAPAAP